MMAAVNVLDLCEAFGVMDHSTLLKCLEKYFDINEKASTQVKWYLIDIT